MKLKKYFFASVILLSAMSAFGQTYNQKQATELSKSYMNAGDSVGIYTEIDGKKQQMEAIKFVGVKTNVLGTALSYGIAKSKIKVEFQGTTSPYTFQSEAHFRFYFGMVPIAKSQRLYMFSPAYTLRDFAISKFVVKKNKRQLVQGSFSLWGGCKTGVESDGEVSVTSRQIKEGVYDVIVKAKPGEYCFVFTNNGVGGYSSVFDFTIQ